MSTPRGAILRSLPPSVIIAARAAKVALAPRGGEALTRALGAGRSRGVTIRPVRPGDEHAWREAMVANHERMARWWSIAPDIDTAAGHVAFVEHIRAWDQRLKRGYGACLALVDERGYIGELQLWHMRPGGLTCEVGAWLSPERPDAMWGVVGCLAHTVDALFEVGIRRIDAPVAAGNTMPRRLLAMGGFELDASIPAWREHRGELADFDLFGLTLARWEHARPTVWSRVGSWERVSS